MKKKVVREKESCEREKVMRERLERVVRERVVGERLDNPSQAPRPSLWKTVSLSLHVFPSLSHGGG